MRNIEEAKKLLEQLDGGELLENDPDLKDIMTGYLYGEVNKHGSLDMELRELIMIVVNTTNNTLKALRRHVKEGLNCGLNPTLIKEVIYQATPYIGLGKVEEALDVVNEVFNEKGISLPLESNSTVNEETRFEKGLEVQSMPFGKDNILANHEKAPAELKHIQNYLTEYCFGDFYTRKQIDMARRELFTMVVIATLGGCENQLRAHVNGNLNMGNSRELLIETITQCQPYIGFPRTLNALGIINEVWNARK